MGAAAVGVAGFSSGDLGIQEMELSLVEARATAKTNRSRNPFRRRESTEEITQLLAEEKTPERPGVHAPATHHVHQKKKHTKLWVSLALPGVTLCFQQSTHLLVSRLLGIERSLSFLRRAIHKLP